MLPTAAMSEPAWGFGSGTQGLSPRHRSSEKQTTPHHTTHTHTPSQMELRPPEHVHEARRRPLLQTVRQPKTTGLPKRTTRARFHRPRWHGGQHWGGWARAMLQPRPALGPDHRKTKSKWPALQSAALRGLPHAISPSSAHTGGAGLCIMAHVLRSSGRESFGWG